MGNVWHFFNPVRISFGRGCREHVIKDLIGKRCLVVTSKRGRAQLSSDKYLGDWVGKSAILWSSNVRSNPDIRDLEAEIKRLKMGHIEAILAFGGGSAIDSAKALSLALSDTLRDLSLCDIVGRPELYQKVVTIPIYAVPTTSGTGSEVTPFSTIWDHEHKKKLSLHGDAVYAHGAFIDPELTDELPENVTLTGGLDAINQALESIWNKNATPITFELATRALEVGLSALPNLIEGKGGVQERDQMFECSLLAGMAISQTRTALCHSISYPLTLRFGVPHGLACAFTMPSVLRLNLGVDDGRFEMLAKRLSGGSSQAGELLGIFTELNETMRVSSMVKKHVSDIKKVLPLIGEMNTPGRADNNLAEVSSNVIEQIILESWGK